MVVGVAESRTIDCGVSEPGGGPADLMVTGNSRPAARDRPPPYTSTLMSCSGVAAGMVSVALARPLPSDSALVRNCGGAAWNDPSGVSNWMFALRTGLPSPSRTTAVTTDRPGLVSVTTTVDGLATATRSCTWP